MKSGKLRNYFWLKMKKSKWYCIDKDNSKVVSLLSGAKKTKATLFFLCFYGFGFKHWSMSSQFTMAPTLGWQDVELIHYEDHTTADLNTKVTES